MNREVKMNKNSQSNSRIFVAQDNAVAVSIPPGLVISKLFTCENCGRLYCGYGKMQGTEKGKEGF